MTLQDIIKTIKENWALIVALVIVLSPILWGIAASYHSGQINALREQANLLREQNEFLERKLREMPTAATAPANAGDTGRGAGGKPGAGPNPTAENPQQLTKNDVRKLAEFYGLTRHWKVNPQLRFQEGDISYWYEQKLNDQQLRLEFESRRIVLERAESAGEQIDSQGDLSYLAEKVRTTLLKVKDRGMN